MLSDAQAFAAVPEWLSNPHEPTSGFSEASVQEEDGDSDDGDEFSTDEGGAGHGDVHEADGSFVFPPRWGGFSLTISRFGRITVHTG